MGGEAATTTNGSNDQTPAPAAAVGAATADGAGGLEQAAADAANAVAEQERLYLVNALRQIGTAPLVYLFHLFPENYSLKRCERMLLCEKLQNANSMRSAPAV